MREQKHRGIVHARDEDIVRLDVQVDQAHRVDVLQTLRERAHDGHRDEYL